jgi:hypothetical protein
MSRRDACIRDHSWQLVDERRSRRRTLTLPAAAVRRLPVRTTALAHTSPSSRMTDPAKVIVAVSLFSSVAYVIKHVSTLIFSVAARDADRRPAVIEGQDDRLARLEQAVESIAIEVERISEGQRFTTRLLSERAQADQARDRISASVRG